jgi:DNA-binding NtrC family response regulator
MTLAAHKPSRILLVDDEDRLRSCIATALRERGYEAIEARCGRDAVAAAEATHPDASLLDMNMPDMTGVDVLRSWLSRGLRFPVIIMTAEATQDLRIEAVRLGALEVISKPFGVQDLFGHLARALSQLHRPQPEVHPN